MKYILSVLIAIVLGFSIWSGTQLYNQSQLENAYKYDFSEINKIKYGLFNLDIWKEKVFGVLQKNVDEFEIKASDLKGIRKQIDIYLNQLYKDYFESGKLIEVLLDSQDSKEKNLGKMFVGLFKKNIEKEIKKIDFKSQIPAISNALMGELEKKIPEIKSSISASVSNMLTEELGETLKDQRQGYFDKFGAENIDQTNLILKEKIEEILLIKKKTLVQTLAALTVAFLLILIGMLRIPFRVSMLWLGALCIVCLSLGLTLPMIDLDARLSSVDINLLGETIHFDEQVMYYQSKSIFDVTLTLLEGRGIDLKIVGILILLFSIVLPFLKMVLSVAYLYFKSLRSKTLVEIIIFYLGKWSMADVFVVAIFMSYIGFYGLISSQLGDMSGQSQSSAIDTINYSKLSPGIIFFTAYCILSIIMSTLIHRKIKKNVVGSDSQIV